MILKTKQYKKDTFGDFQWIKVRYVPGLQPSTQYRFSAKPTVNRSVLPLPKGAWLLIGRLIQKTWWRVKNGFCFLDPPEYLGVFFLYPYVDYTIRLIRNSSKNQILTEEIANSKRLFGRTMHPTTFKDIFRYLLINSARWRNFCAKPINIAEVMLIFKVLGYLESTCYYFDEHSKTITCLLRHLNDISWYTRYTTHSSLSG